MANQPAAENKEEVISPKLSLEGLEEGSPAWKHKKKLLEQEAKRKKGSVVTEQWIETQKDASKKGEKVRLKKRLKNGNVHTFYLGRYLKGGKEAIQAYAMKGVFVNKIPPKGWKEVSKGKWAKEETK